jgi:hypothetical protein
MPTFVSSSTLNRFALLLVAATCLVAPASAQTSVLRGNAGTSFLGTLQQSYTEVPVASLTSLVVHDAYGNDGIAHGSIATPDGRFVLSPHACSGGGPGFGGSATGSAFASVTLDYKIVSATLPPGTPVSVLVHWAMSARVTAVGQDMVGSNTGANASAGGHVSIAPNYAVVVNMSGSLSRSTSASGDQVIRSGALNVESDHGEHTFSLQVGQALRLFISGEVGANSSVEAGTTDGDVQMAAVWGVSSLDPAASAVLLSNPSQPAPPAELATPEIALELLPPRDVNLLPCFRIPTQPVDVDACDVADATFSVVAQGSGPFTYQWRKHGVPMDIETYPSAATGTLVLMNVSPEDAGSYDVVVSNACGDIVSSAATLSACPAAHALPERPELALRSHPNPFNPGTELAFALPEAGDIELAVFDLRGARVTLLHHGHLEAGEHVFTWDGRSDHGRSMPSGVYLARIATRSGASFARLTMLE